MHEVGIIQSMLAMAEEHALKAAAKRIHEIRLRIGRMSGVVPEALAHAFAVLQKGTMAEEAQLSIEDVAAVCWCDVCQKDFAAEEIWSQCPHCGTPTLEVKSGMEVQLISLEVE